MSPIFSPLTSVIDRNKFFNSTLCLSILLDMSIFIRESTYRCCRYAKDKSFYTNLLVEETKKKKKKYIGRQSKCRCRNKMKKKKCKYKISWSRKDHDDDNNITQVCTKEKCKRQNYWEFNCEKWNTHTENQRGWKPL